MDKFKFNGKSVSAASTNRNPPTVTFQPAQKPKSKQNRKEHRKSKKADKSVKKMEKQVERLTIQVSQMREHMDLMEERIESIPIRDSEGFCVLKRRA